MNVIYDVTVLGQGFYNPKARTGVFRVIENIANQLGKLDSCCIRFCALTNIEDYIKTKKYLRHSSLLEGSAWIGFDKIYLNVIAEILSYLYPGPNSKVYGPFPKFLESLKAYYQFLDHHILEQTDIVHSSFYPLPEYLARHRKLQKFLTIYDLIPILFPQYFSNDRNHILYEIMDSIKPYTWIVTISESTKNDLCNYMKIEPSRVFVTYLAASRKLFHRCDDPQIIDRVLKKYNIPAVPYVLSLCTLEPRKNIAHAIRCFSRLICEERINDLNLVLVGVKGWDFDDILSAIGEARSIKKRIIVTGYVEDTDLAALYSSAMMFVYPSLYEGFGLPPLEAMQCGVPVITSKTSSLPEVVGDAGILVDPHDADALCQSMLNLYNHKSLRERMSESGIDRAKMFSWKQCASDTMSAYQASINR